MKEYKYTGVQIIQLLASKEFIEGTKVFIYNGNTLITTSIVKDDGEFMYLYSNDEIGELPNGFFTGDFDFIIKEE